MPEEAVPFSTHARCPYLVCFEVAEGEEGEVVLFRLVLFCFVGCCCFGLVHGESREDKRVGSKRRAVERLNPEVRRLNPEVEEVRRLNPEVKTQKTESHTQKPNR